ncbi:MAG: translation initiation factor IF-3 [bacterium]|nr:translation initiation factor IF-3 [bacterium]
MGRYYRLNNNIQAKEVRLLDSAGKQLGVVGIEEARRQAQEQGLDLVEVAASAKPPVVKIIDFKKFKYEEAKRERQARKHTHETDTKEVWLGPLISTHDLETRLKRAKEFLAAGDRVKLNVRFSGREMAHPEFGHEVLKKSEESLVDFGIKDGTPKFFGRNLVLSFNPIKKH